VLQFVRDVVKGAGKEERMRPFVHIELDWIVSRQRARLAPVTRSPTRVD